MRVGGVCGIVGAILLLVGCLPDPQVPSGEQMLASRVPVRIPLYAADSHGPLFVLSDDATIAYDRAWKNLRILRPGNALPPPVTERTVVDVSLAFDRLFLTFGERGTENQERFDVFALGVLSPGLTETSWISTHVGFREMSVTATRFVIRTDDALVVGDAAGRTRKFGAALRYRFDGDERLYFRAKDSKVLFRSDGLDAAPLGIDQDVQSFVVDKVGRFLSVHEDGLLFLGSAAGPVAALSGVGKGSCDELALLEAASTVLCVRLPNAVSPTSFTGIDLDTGRVFNIGLGTKEYLGFTIRHDVPAAYFRHDDRTIYVDGTGNRIDFPFVILAPIFTSDHKTVVYVTTSPSGDVALPSRLVVGSSDFSGMPVSAGPESLSRYLSHGITEGETGSHLVFVGESGTGSTHLYSRRLDTPIGEVRHLATGVSAYVMRGDHLVALVNLSSQDRTGHLVEYDLGLGSERLISAGVLDFAVGQRCNGCGIHPEHQVAYLVRTRLPEPAEGLWVAPLTPDIPISHRVEPFASPPPSSPLRSGVRPL
jgi:hypothetical protein